MRRLNMIALASVSLVTLVSVATASQAITPQNFGTLKQQDNWKVGIVDPEGQSFCAMVNKFDKNVGLAFAMSPEGYGSVAIDILDKSFTPGDIYQVTLKPEGMKAGTYPGRATSDRSVVVQIGQNKAFYDALKSNASLSVGMPAVDAAFSLNQFGKSYASLIECSQSLTTKGQNALGGPGPMPAVKVKEVQATELAPLDRELQKISGTETADNTAKPVLDKSASFDNAEAALDSKTPETKPADVKTAEADIPTPPKADIEWSDAKTAEVKTEIGAQKQQVAELEGQKQKVERKLLASITAAPEKKTVVATADSTAAAKQLEQQQIARAAEVKAADEANEKLAAAKAEDEKKQALLKQADDEAKARIAALEASKAEEAKAHVAEFNAQKKALDDKSAALQKQVASIETAKAAAPAVPAAPAAAPVVVASSSIVVTPKPEDKALKASLVAKQAQIAALENQRQQQTEALTQKLSATQAEYQNKVATAESERDLLKRQLTDAIASQKASGEKIAALQTQLDTTSQKVQLSAADKAKLNDLQGKLAQSEQDKQQMQARLEALDKQNKLMEATLTSRQKTLESASLDAKELETVKNALDSLKVQHKSTVDKLQKQLDDKTAQYDALNNQYAALQKTASNGSATGIELAKQRKELTDQLAAKEQHVAELEQKLAKLESDRASALAVADKAQGEVKGLRKSLVIVDDDKMPESLRAPKIAEITAKDKAELESTKSKVALLEGQLSSSHDQIESLEKLVTEAKTASAQPRAEDLAAINAQNAKLADAQATIDQLKTANAALEGKMKQQLPTMAQVRTLDEQKSRIDMSQAEIDSLKAQNATLTSKLAEAEKAAASAAASAKMASIESAKVASIEPAAGEAVSLAPIAQNKAQTKTAAAEVPQAVVAPIPAPITIAKLDAKAVAREREMAAANLERFKRATADAAAHKPIANDVTPVNNSADIQWNDAPVDSTAPAKVAQVELAPVKSPKPLRKPLMAIKDTAPAVRTTAPAVKTASKEMPLTQRELMAVEPAAGGDNLAPITTANPTVSDSWFNGSDATDATAHAPVGMQPIYGKDARKPLVAAAQPVKMTPPVATTRVVQQTTVMTPAQMPAVPVAKVETTSMTTTIANAMPVTPAKDPDFDEGRASAFLDRIMAYHRPNGATPKEMPVTATAPVFAPSAPAPVRPQLHLKAASIETTRGLSSIETAAGTPSRPITKMQPTEMQPTLFDTPVKTVTKTTTVTASSAPVDLAPVVATPLVSAPVAVQQTTVATSAAGMPVEQILKNAGITDAEMKPADGGSNVRQWTTGGISGMQEQMAAKVPFGTAVQNYIGRYREDCKGLTVNMDAPATISGGTVQEANISCANTGNTYSTSFVFFQQGSTFNAILHSGFPDDAASVQSLSHSIASSLTGMAAPHRLSLMTPNSVDAADAAAAMPADRPRFHLNMPVQTPVAASTATFGARPDDDFETVVIQ